MGLFSNLFKDKFGEWMKSASYEELSEAYEKMRLTDFMKTGVKTPEMKRLDAEMYRRSLEKWEKEHPRKPGEHPKYWSDINRWE